ncbi:MAG: gliding motility-associated C-terminal domain-containing protein [Bacteroidota bacterium]
MTILLRSIVLLGLLFVSFTSFAQKDTEFWFAAPEVAQDHGDRPVRFRLSAFEDDAVVIISMPANPSFQTKTIAVPANTVQSVDVTTDIELIENKPPNRVLDKGILIEASSPIMAYYEVLNDFNPDIFPLKGNNALGELFFAPTQFTYNNEHGNNSLDIVATRDGTTITITPTQNVVGHPAGESFTIVLNRGETFSVAATSTAGAGHLRGTKIVSDKPIAVTSSDDSIRITFGWDLIGDQLVPVSLIGTDYIAIRGNFDGEGVYVTATEDGTQISASGAAPASTNLDEGESARFRFSSSTMFLSANKPIYVLHLTGEDVEAGSALLPPLNCTGAEQVGFIKGSGTNYLYLLTEDGNQDFFELNGNATTINGSAFSQVPGSNGQYVAAKINATGFLSNSTTNIIRNTNGLFHLGVMYYTGPGSAYGYFSQYNSLYFGGEITICDGEVGMLDAGENRDSYLWSDGSTGRFLEVTEPGKYWVTVEYQTCTLTDTADVFVIKAPLDLGEDTTLCIGQSLRLDATHPYGSYLWQDGSTDSTLIVSQEGRYSITRTVDGCATTDEINVSFIGPPRVELGGDTTLCRGELLQLDLYTPGMTYTWQDGSTDSVYVIESPGQYWVDVSLQGCVTRDSIYNNSIFDGLELGGDTLLCDNEFMAYDLSFPNTEYLWGDGSSSPIRIIDQAGEYTIRISDVCQTVYDTLRLSYHDCSCGVSVPSAFSPNNDGTNDEFGAFYHCLIDDFNLRVYNRWGLEVFNSDNPDELWDGTYQGKPISVGVYVWVLTYYGSRSRRPVARQESGMVTLIR